MSKKITDKKTNLINSIIAEQLAIDTEKEIKDLPNVDHDFSRLDTWFDNYLDQVEEAKDPVKNKKIPHRYLRTAATLVFALALSTLVLAGNTEAFRLLNFNLFMEDKEEYTSISKIEDEELHKEQLLPAYLPEDMELTRFVELNNITIAKYESSLHELTLKISGINTTIMFDTENLDIKEFEELNGFYVLEDSFLRAYWSTDSYHFTIVTNLDINELVKIAKSID